MKKRVFIVDDEENILFSLKLSISKAGYEVITAGNGMEAFENLALAQKSSTPFHLLILDIYMPVMNGLELLSALGNIGIKIPFIVMTGFGSKELAIDLLRKGCTDFLDKPFMAEELIARVKTILGDPKLEPVWETQTDMKTGGTLHKVSVMEGWVEIAPLGDITPQSAESLRGILVEMLERGNAKFRFNMAGVEDMHAAGLGLFLLFGKIMAEMDKESRLEIVNANSDITTLFQKTGMDGFYFIGRQKEAVHGL